MSRIKAGKWRRHSPSKRRSKQPSSHLKMSTKQPSYQHALSTLLEAGLVDGKVTKYSR